MGPGTLYGSMGQDDGAGVIRWKANTRVPTRRGPPSGGSITSYGEGRAAGSGAERYRDVGSVRKDVGEAI